MWHLCNIPKGCVNQIGEWLPCNFAPLLIHSNQDWQDRSRDRRRGLHCTYARNATERQRSARGLAVWHQHAGITASIHANISTRRLFRSSIISSNRLFSAAAALLPCARGTGSLAPACRINGLKLCQNLYIYIYIYKLECRFPSSLSAAIALFCSSSCAVV